MAVQEIKTTFLLKRALAGRWIEVNPILKQGEPGFEIDTNKLKIGDGIHQWTEIEYIGYGDSSTGVFNADTVAGFPPIGTVDVIYKAAKEKALYQWNAATLAYEILSAGEIDLDEVLQELLNRGIEQTKYEVAYKPENTRINITDYEIRIMCPADTKWELQNSGPNSNPNSYYIGFKAYAPEDAVGFKEDLAEIIADTKMYYFENNDFAGIDDNGRKYSIVWLPVASYDPDTATWSYYGSKSSANKYIGWYYTVEWYNANNKVISSNTIRINLSNENCHNNQEPYFMGSININKLTQSDNEYLILYGGSATQVI